MYPVTLVNRTRASLRACLAASAAFAATAGAAQAQQAQPSPPPPTDGPRLPPSVGDFRLEPRRRIVTQPRPAPQPQSAPDQAAPAAEPPAQRAADPRPRADTPRPLPSAPRAPVPTAPAAGQAGRDAAPAAPDNAPPATALPPAADLPPASAFPSEPAPAAAAPVPAPVTAPATSGLGDGPPLWMILLGGLALGLVGYTAFTRRRSVQRRALALAGGPALTAAPEPAAPRVPRPDPVPRPWLDIELTPERTTADPEESAVEFEMRIHNKGGSTASGIKVQAKLFCSTPDQDKEIAAFHRKKPGEHRTLAIPDLAAGEELRIKGRVDIKRDQIKVLRVEGRLLFVPLIAVNAFYGWGNARSGQTSKSFLVGREQADAAEKMAPFRMDLGPRVYRTVGQRPYAVERRL